MKKVALLYNPLAGGRPRRRLAAVKTVVAVWREAGVEVIASPTRVASDATPQVRQAIAEGCDSVFACGGDGTVHDVLQALVGSQVALGIIPLGTANALAHDLRIPLSSARAAGAALTAKPKRIAIAQATYRDLAGNPASRYFTVALGAGVDAHLFHELDPRVKLRLGMAAYYAQATWLWLTHRMRSFAVEVREADGKTREAEVSELLAVRIGNFGGVLRQLAPGASLDRDDLRLVLFRTRSRLTYLRYIVRGLVGARWEIDGIDLVHAASVVCRPLPGAENLPFYVEADGEILGTLPVEVRVVPDALTILMPEQ